MFLVGRAFLRLLTQTVSLRGLAHFTTSTGGFIVGKLRSTTICHIKRWVESVTSGSHSLTHSIPSTLSYGFINLFSTLAWRIDTWPRSREIRVSTSSKRNYSKKTVGHDPLRRCCVLLYYHTSYFSAYLGRLHSVRPWIIPNFRSVGTASLKIPSKKKIKCEGLPSGQLVMPLQQWTIVTRQATATTSWAVMSIGVSNCGGMLVLTVFLNLSQIRGMMRPPAMTMNTKALPQLSA